MKKNYNADGVGLKTIIKMNKMGNIHAVVTKNKHRSILKIIMDFIMRKKTE